MDLFKNKNFWKQIALIFIVSLLTTYGVFIGLPMAKIIAVFMFMYTVYMVGMFIAKSHKDKEWSKFGITLYTWQSIFSVMLLLAAFSNNEIINVITVIMAFATFAIYSIMEQ